MIPVTLEQLTKIMPAGKSRLPKFVDPLNSAMVEFSINTPARVAAFLAQLAHESGQFRYMAEIASGVAYEGRADLGNTKPGDGRKFKGHGPIQITGRKNHRDCSLVLYGDERLLDVPELLEQPDPGCRAAGWFWKTRGLNMLADHISGPSDFDTFDKITKRINGGYGGRDERRDLWTVAQQVIHEPF